MTAKMLIQKCDESMATKPIREPKRRHKVHKSLLMEPTVAKDKKYKLKHRSPTKTKATKNVYSIQCVPNLRADLKSYNYTGNMSNQNIL